MTRVPARTHTHNSHVAMMQDLHEQEAELAMHWLLCWCFPFQHSENQHYLQLQPRKRSSSRHVCKPPELASKRRGTGVPTVEFNRTLRVHLWSRKLSRRRRRTFQLTLPGGSRRVRTASFCGVGTVAGTRCCSVVLRAVLNLPACQMSRLGRPQAVRGMLWNAVLDVCRVSSLTRVMQHHKSLACSQA